MVKRIFLAYLLGGVAIFLWQFVAHMVTPLGDAGIKALPNEQAIQKAIKDTVREPGFYFFPAPEDKPGLTTAQKGEAMAKAQERSLTEPGGIMIVHPAGPPFNFPRLLMAQLGFDLLAALVATILLLWSAIQSYAKRVVFVAFLGLIPTFAVELSLRNWYGFPGEYTAAQAFVHLVGFICCGLVVAAFIKPRPTYKSPAFAHGPEATKSDGRASSGA